MPVSATITTTTETTKCHAIKLDGRQIRELLRESGVEIPENANVTLTVPSGGDWSGLDLDIGSDATVNIRWITTAKTRE